MTRRNRSTLARKTQVPDGDRFAADWFDPSPLAVEDPYRKPIEREHGQFERIGSILGRVLLKLRRRERGRRRYGIK